MTINKSQGQTMSICGLDIENPVFSQQKYCSSIPNIIDYSDLFLEKLMLFQNKK